MFEIATPVSHLFKDHQSAQEIGAASDCLECRDQSFHCTLPRQNVFHCDLELIHEWSEKEKDYVASIITCKTDLKLISFHMASSCADPVLVNGIFQVGGKEYSHDDLIKNAAENNHYLLQLLHGTNISVAVENNNYFPTDAYKYIALPSFISDIITANNLKFVFDISHAKISAHNMGISYQDYLQELPMNEIVQIHVSELGYNKDGLACDVHNIPSQSTIDDVTSLLYKHEPAYITIEYYRDNCQLVNLIKLFKNLNCLTEV